MKTTSLRIINLHDCESDYLVETNAPRKEILKALDHKNQMLIDDDPKFRSDFEEMQEFVHSRGYSFEAIGYVEDLEGYDW